MPDDVLNGILDSASDDQSANSTGRTPLVIDSDLRTINVSTDYVFGVQNDQDVLTVPFVVPRYCDGVDLSELSIRINFTTKSGLSSYYDVTDKTVNTDTIEFTWLLGAAVFVSVGDLTFAVCIRKVEADGRITKEFNTTLATAKILPGLTVEDQKDPTQYSILVQMQNLASSVNSTIEDAEEYAEQLRNYVGAPLVATAASDMTDQNRIYVYVGNENGYNNGHWYYYQSLTWHDGGTYNSLTAGDYPDIYAGNVMSDRYQTDQTPYLLRKAASELGSSRIGQRCYPVLVGASVVENQLVTFTESTTTGKGITCNRNADGTIEISGTATDDWCTNVGNTVTSLLNHKILIKGCPPGGSASTYSMRDGYTVGDSNKDFGNGRIIVGKANFIIQIIVMSGTALSTPIIFKPQAIDLTLRLGSTIADYVYTLEQATAGSGIAWLRSYGFLGGYVPYNAGSIESVEVTEKKCVGFNQFDKSTAIDGKKIASDTGVERTNATWARSDYIRVLPNTIYYTNADGTMQDYTVTLYDAEKKYIGYRNVVSAHTFNTGDAFYVILSTIKAIVPIDDLVLNLSSDRNGEYEPYKSTSYSLGSDVLRGIFKLDANNQLYADGDRKEADGTITRRYGLLDLGNLNWTKTTASNIDVGYYYQAGLTLSVSGSLNCILDNYVFLDKIGLSANVAAYGRGLDKVAFRSSNKNIYIIDSAYTDATAFKTAMDGVMLVYELATPTTEQGDPFPSPQIVYPDGTEEFVTENGVPVGHVTKYPYDLKTQAERLIDIPDVPSTNGTYVLKATRSSSGINYTWVTG